MRFAVKISLLYGAASLIYGTASLCFGITLPLAAAQVPAQTSVISPSKSAKAAPASNTPASNMAAAQMLSFPRAKAAAQKPEASPLSASFPAPSVITAPQADERALRRRPKGSRDKAVVPAGFYVERAASGLGEITALASDNEGQLYVLNKAGSVFVLRDRGLDGRIDSQRVLTAGLAIPTGLALAGGYLYAADKSAIWQIDVSTGAREVFVPLTNIEAGEPRPLLYFNNKLVLGLTQKASSKVLSIDMNTRQARLLAEIPSAPLRALSIGSGQMWAAIGSSIRPLGGKNTGGFDVQYPLESGAHALALLLPSKDIRYPEDWPAALREHIIAVQSPAGRPSEMASGGNNVVSLPTLFGAPSPDLLQLVGGFTSQSGQSAWAAPSAVILEPRGLFIADRFGGSLLRLSVDNRPAPTPKKSILPPTPKPLKQKPSHAPNDTPAMAGSSIIEASHLEKAATLEVGSMLKKAHETQEQSQKDKKEQEAADKLEARAKAREERERKRKESIERILRKNRAASDN